MKQYLFNDQAGDKLRAMANTEKSYFDLVEERLGDEEYWENICIDYHVPPEKLKTRRERLYFLGCLELSDLKLVGEGNEDTV